MGIQGTRLEGKVALITGAASGFGLCTAQLFVREGAKIVAVDISADGLKKVKNELGQACMTVEADVTKESTIERAVAEGVKHFGEVTIAVNCAGIPGGGSIVDETEKNWDRVFNVNLKGVLFCMKHEFRQMIKQGEGWFRDQLFVGCWRGTNGGRRGLLLHVESRGCHADQGWGHGDGTS